MIFGFIIFVMRRDIKNSHLCLNYDHAVNHARLITLTKCRNNTGFRQLYRSANLIQSKRLPNLKADIEIRPDKSDGIADDVAQNTSPPDAVLPESHEFSEKEGEYCHKDNLAADTDAQRSSALADTLK